jgi:RimJ/RimL family protein N-acetyltransferase/CheY-like chemotaxis protein
MALYGIEARQFDSVDAWRADAVDRDLDDDLILLSLESESGHDEAGAGEGTGDGPRESLAPLRALCPDGQCAVPVIAMTNDPFESLQASALAAGAVDLIYRPLLASYLFTRLQALLPDAVSLPSTPPSCVRLEDGTVVIFRMMEPGDAEREQAFVAGLSARSRYMRFFHGLRKLSPEMLDDFTHPHYPMSYAVIATVNVDGVETQIGVGRYTPTEEPGVAEFAVVVADAWQGRGIGSQLMHLVTAAAAIGGGIDRLEGMILRQNHGMRALMKKLGFQLGLPYPEDTGMVRMVKTLRRPGGGQQPTQR